MASLAVDDVSLEFPIYDADRSFRKSLFHAAVGGVIHRDQAKRNRVTVTALDGVSLSLKQGDRLGLVGTNGAGKSSLLKVMAGIYEPDRGKVIAEGKLSCQFGSLPGVDGDDNAYRNIFAVCRFFDMSKEEIVEKIASIEEFCELGDYMSMPLRTYSAGMMARLTFAIATSMDPEVLLMDEGIGAGDARFARKAKARIADFLDKAHIVVLASHSNELIREMCNQAVLMQAGKIVEIGPVESILATHERLCLT
jgi:ABC-type polysaccharide/polyol phosphate transport system ATPase subunit